MEQQDASLVVHTDVMGESTQSCEVVRDYYRVFGYVYREGPEAPELKDPLIDFYFNTEEQIPGVVTLQLPKGTYLFKYALYIDLLSEEEKNALIKLYGSLDLPIASIEFTLAESEKQNVSQFDVSFSLNDPLPVPIPGFVPIPGVKYPLDSEPRDKDLKFAYKSELYGNCGVLTATPIDTLSEGNSIRYVCHTDCPPEIPKVAGEPLYKEEERKKKQVCPIVKQIPPCDSHDIIKDDKYEYVYVPEPCGHWY